MPHAQRNSRNNFSAPPAPCPVPTYTYNAENQLTSTAGITYTYDGDGKRVQKSNGTIYWYGMGSDPLDETDLTGNISNTSFNEYIFFNGKRIARRDSTNAINYYFADHLGTARLVTNSSGAILDDSDFYPFGGERVILSSSGNKYRFTGKERDSESGLDNFGARYDASSLGRFMTPDPMGGHLEDPQTLNRYAYVRNNPVNLTDPTGLDFNLNCDKNNGTTCQGGHQYYKDKDGNYQETVVKSDKDGNLTDQRRVAHPKCLALNPVAYPLRFCFSQRVENSSLALASHCTVHPASYPNLP